MSAGPQRSDAGRPLALLPAVIGGSSVHADALATEFLRDHWRITLYYDVHDDAARQHALRLSNALRGAPSVQQSSVPPKMSLSTPRGAAEPPGAPFHHEMDGEVEMLGVDFGSLTTIEGANALLERAAASHAGDESKPMCVVTSPLSGSGQGGMVDAVGATVAADAGRGWALGDIEGRYRDDTVPALRLTEAMYRQWTSTASPAGADPVIVHILDGNAGDARDADLAFAMAQNALSAAVPALAQRSAPPLRVVAISTPLVFVGAFVQASDNASAKAISRNAAENMADISALSAAVAQSASYLARASTITGSTLLVDGGAACLNTLYAKPTNGGAP